ncbi:hypothetical protein [Streptomyces sp. NPDC037389]
MVYLIRVPVDGCEPVLVEAADGADGIVRVARPSEVIAAAEAHSPAPCA